MNETISAPSDFDRQILDLVAISSDWLWQTDVRDRYVYVSPCVLEKLGIAPSALLGRPRRKPLPDTAEAEHWRQVEQHLPFRNFVSVLKLADHDEKIVRFSGIPLFDDQGQFQGYRGIASNITQQVRAEERAHQAELLLTDAIETISDGFGLYDDEDRLVICNSHYRNLLQPVHYTVTVGESFEHVVRTSAAAGGYGYQGKELAAFIVERLRQHAVADGKPYLHRLAHDRWSMSKEYRTHNGGTVCIRTDVTDLTHQQDELSKLKQHYERLLGSAGDGIFGIDETETITYANPMALQLLGFERSDLEGMNFHELMSDATTDCPLPALPSIQDKVQSSEGRFLRADGSAFFAEFVLTPIIESGATRGGVLVFRDVSLRKRYEEGIANHQRELETLVEERTRKLSTEIEQRSRTEEALSKSTSRLLGITSNLFEGVLLVDLNGHILFANRSAHRMLADETYHLAGTDLDEIMRIEDHGQIKDFLDGPLSQTAATGETLIVDDGIFVTSTNRRLAVGFAVAPLEEGGKRRSAVISFRSIESLKTAQREALQSSRLASVGQLAAGIAHEINTPIQYVGDNLRFISDSLAEINQAIKGVETLMDSGALPAQNAAQLKELFTKADLDYLLTELPLATSQSLDGVGHVAHIVRSMKDFSHPGSAGKATTDINHAIDSTITVSSNEWKHQATIQTELNPNLPAIACFPAEINQVLLNLIVNAAHAIESENTGKLGRIVVSTRQDDKFIEIRISDDGPGVPPAIRDKIYDPFFTTKTVGKGTGQGLSICMDVVANKHGGKLFLEDKPTKGATFVIRLPIE